MLKVTKRIIIIIIIRWESKYTWINLCGKQCGDNLFVY